MILNCFRYPASPDPTHPKLLFLHGMGGTGQLWRPIAATLEDEFDLLCPDQRGHGRSIPSQATDWSFRPEDYAADVAETTEQLSFSPAWVIGHSMGVRTAVGYAKLCPDRVDGLVLIDLGFSGLAGGGVGDALAEFLKILPERFASRGEAREFMTRHCPDPSIGQYLIAVSQVGPDGGVTFPFDHEALRLTVEQARGANTFENLEIFVRESGKPVYVLRGVRSQVYTHADFVADRERAKALGNVHFIEFQDAGHGLPFEKRAEFIARLKEWMTGR